MKSAMTLAVYNNKNHNCSVSAGQETTDALTKQSRLSFELHVANIRRILLVKLARLVSVIVFLCVPFGFSLNYYVLSLMFVRLSIL